MSENVSPDQPGPVPPVLELDHVFDALARPRRRYLLYVLSEHGEVSLQALARKIAACEQDAPESTVTDEEFEEVYVSLYHNHVPKLIEDGIVAFTEADERLSPAANAQQVFAVLDSAGGVHDSERERHARQENDEGYS